MILYYKVRLIGKAVELSPNQISNLWSQEPIFAKIRSRISECGKPLDFADHKNDHDKLLTEYENGQDSLPQTETYTAFKIIPRIWDFYKSEPNCVADRVQYRKSEDEKWSIMHVAS
ncbi:pyridoxine/pyridoxamine 5'-phosphate oxidase-like [Episyrphus balteatus]|uniref:pyridoxine/pyridoxamine 5'-phosphate oxidase-like n=1 Tax=Episyrphus balteatus TaxID=286459 RepID=UPI002484F6E8|nr:pyridoxine/pyridoxamine 5'-phosphate oxidase-like [Episyrphus balteatus]